MFGSCWVCIILGKNLFKISSTVKIYCTSNLAGIGVRVIIWDSLNLFAEVVNENKKTGRRKWAKVNKHWGLDCAREVVPLKFFQKAKLPPGTINDRLLKKKKEKKKRQYPWKSINLFIFPCYSYPVPVRATSLTFPLQIPVLINGRAFFLG